MVSADELLRIGGRLDPTVIARMMPKQKATRIGEIMEPFWQGAEALMGPQFYDQLKGWVRVLSFLEGEPRVQDSR